MQLNLVLSLSEGPLVFKFYLLLRAALSDSAQQRTSGFYHLWLLPTGATSYVVCMFFSRLDCELLEGKNQGQVHSAPPVLTCLPTAHLCIAYFPCLHSRSGYFILQHSHPSQSPVFPAKRIVSASDNFLCYSPFRPSIKIYLLLVPTHCFKLLSNYSICAYFIFKERS